MTEIERIRTELGLSQTAFAEVMKTTQATVSRWEAGKANPNQWALEYARSLLGQAA